MKRLFFCFSFLCISCYSTELVPAKEPLLEEGAGVAIDAELIYWIAKEEGLNYATSGFSAPPGSEVITKGNVQYPGFRFNPGFKAGFTFSLPHDDWILIPKYTWIRNGYDQSNTQRLNSDTELYENWIRDSVEPFQATNIASGRWKIQHNIVTLDIGRQNQRSDFFIMSNYIGLIGAWNTQNFIIKYSDVFDDDTTTAQIVLLQHFYGIGPRAVMETEFYISNKWHVYADLSLAALWSYFSGTEKTRLITEEDSPITSFLGYKKKLATPVFGWGMGLKWETPAKDDVFSLVFQIGYEQQIWFNQNQFQNLLNTNSGNLTYDGLTLKLEIGF